MKMENKKIDGNRNFYINQNKFFAFNNSTNSFVVNTCATDCFLKCGSFDQIGHLFNARDSAKYSVSSGSEIRLLASLRNSSYSDRGRVIIFALNLLNKNSKSLEGSLEINFILDLCSSTSLNRDSGQYNLIDSKNIMSFVTPLPVRPVNSIVASTINPIYLSSGCSFLSFLYMPAFTSLANFNASFSVSLDLDTIDLNNLYSFISLEIALLAISDQFNSGKESISDLSSFGTANVNVGIFNPPLAVNASNYVYYVQLYKPFDWAIIYKRKNES